MTYRLMIVDDHAGFRELASTLFRGAGLQVVGAAATGAQALAMLAQCRPQVALIDVQLPDTTGFELCQTIRLERPQLQVVLCSIHPAADYGPQATSCGAAGFLAKAQLSASAVLAFLR